MAEALEAEAQSALEAATKAQAEAVEAFDSKAQHKKNANKRRHGRKSYTDEQQEQRERDLAAQRAAAKQPAGPSAAAPSSFAELTAKLKTAADIAVHLREQLKALSAKGQGADRGLNQLLQALSSRPADVYEDLFANHPAETLWILERLSGGFAGGSVTNVATQHAAATGAAKPAGNNKSSHKGGANHHHNNAPLDLAYAHEFTARALLSSTVQSNDAGASYGSSATPIGDNVPLPVLTAGEMIADFVARDPEGHVARLMQIATSADHITMALAALEKHALRQTTDRERHEAPKISPASAGVLLARAMSKSRQLAQTLHHVGKGGDAAAADGDEEGATDAAPPAKAAPAPAAAAAATPPTAEEIAAATLLVGRVLASAETLCVKNAIAPPPKTQHFLDWVASNELLGEDELAIVEQLVERVTGSVAAQATSMELVLELKVASTRQELRAAVDKVLRRPPPRAVGDDVSDADDEGGDKAQTAAAGPSAVTLTVNTPDVLSALGVAGSQLRAALKDEPSVEGEDLCSDILRALQSASRATPPVALPRRAQRFVDEEARRTRAQDPKRPRVEDLEAAAGNADAADSIVVSAESQRKPTQPR